MLDGMMPEGVYKKLASPAGIDTSRETDLCPLVIERVFGYAA